MRAAPCATDCKVRPRSRPAAPLPAKTISLMIIIRPLLAVSNSIGMISFTRDSE